MNDVIEDSTMLLWITSRIALATDHVAFALGPQDRTMPMRDGSATRWR
jgi:hypothetical protein